MTEPPTILPRPVTLASGRQSMKDNVFTHIDSAIII
jgi:hypothetical protein